MMARADEKKKKLIDAARRKVFILYEGKRTPHRSCGICLAETFNLPTQPYQSLRRGGITGEGQCGAIKAGELILGQYLGDPDPTGAVTDALRSAMQYYSRRWKEELGLPTALDTICNRLVEPFGEFTGEPRAQFCAHLATEVAGLVAETLLEFGVQFEITPIEGLEGR